MLEGNSAGWLRAGSEVVGAGLVWQGPNAATTSDVTLVSPLLAVGDSDEDLVVSFEHRFSFGSGDGGVIDISLDRGETWDDVAAYTDAGYNGVIDGGDTGGSFTNRSAFVGESLSWPATDNVSLNFGTMFSGQVIQIRFRIATNATDGAHGWEIDNISADGIDNDPFWAAVPNSGMCDCIDCGRPVANAGTDQVVRSGGLVILDASESFDPDGDLVRFDWVQLSGPGISLDAYDVVTPSFMAPWVSSDEQLTFQVTVTDTKTINTDTVDVKIVPLFRSNTLPCDGLGNEATMLPHQVGARDPCRNHGKQSYGRSGHSGCTVQPVSSKKDGLLALLLLLTLMAGRLQINRLRARSTKAK